MSWYFSGLHTRPAWSASDIMWPSGSALAPAGAVTLATPVLPTKVLKDPPKPWSFQLGLRWHGNRTRRTHKSHWPERPRISDQCNRSFTPLLVGCARLSYNSVSPKKGWKSQREDQLNITACFANRSVVNKDSRARCRICCDSIVRSVQASY